MSYSSLKLFSLLLNFRIIENKNLLAKVYPLVAQKKIMIVEHIAYRHCVQKGEKLFALYYPKARSLDGSDIEAEVICYFQFQDNQIFKAYGQVRLIKGEFSDVDMEHYL